MGERLEAQTLQLIRGEFVPFQEICLSHAENTFRVRLAIGDTNPQIVQMKLRGQLIPHWYYRSKQWVDQPYFIPLIFLQPYVGPAGQANPGQYGEGTFEVDEEITNLFREQYGK